MILILILIIKPVRSSAAAVVLHSNGQGLGISPLRAGQDIGLGQEQDREFVPGTVAEAGGGIEKGEY